MTRAKKFEATTYLRTDNPESIADLAHDLDVKRASTLVGGRGSRSSRCAPRPASPVWPSLWRSPACSPRRRPRPPGTFSNRCRAAWRIGAAPSRAPVASSPTPDPDSCPPPRRGPVRSASSPGSGARIERQCALAGPAVVLSRGGAGASAAAPPSGPGARGCALVTAIGRLVEGSRARRRRVAVGEVVGAREAVGGIRVVLVAGPVAELLHQARRRIEDVRGRASEPVCCAALCARPRPR